MLSISRNVCPCVCLCVCLFTFEVPFRRFFAPIFRSRMSNIFRDSESLGKSNGKKWSQIWTFLFGNGLKLANKKIVFFYWSSHTKNGGNHASWWIIDLWLKVFCILDDFFRFSNNSGFGLFLVHPETMLPNGLETSGPRAYC